MPSHPRGFTLIEILLYVASAGVTLLVTANALLMVLDARAKHQAIAEVNDTGALVLERVLQTIRNAEDVTAPAAGTSASSLTLDVADAAADPTAFDLSGGAIRSAEGVSSPVPLSNALRVTASGLTFTNLSAADTPGSVRVQFTLDAVNPSGRNAFSFSRTFYGSASLRQP